MVQKIYPQKKCIEHKIYQQNLSNKKFIINKIIVHNIFTISKFIDNKCIEHKIYEQNLSYAKCIHNKIYRTQNLS